MEEWIGLYRSGLSTYQIAGKHDTYARKVWLFLKKSGIELRSTSEAASKLPADKIINEYVAGASARLLAKKHDSTITSITDLLKRHDVVVRQPPRTKSDWSFIYDNRQLFMYWLGWILADGYVNHKFSDNRKKGVVVGLSVHRNDNHILRYFRNAINPDAAIVTIKNTKSNSLTLSIPREDAEYLQKWGLSPRKSLTLAPTKNLEELSASEFFQMLVGYIEGDGCIYNNKGKPVCEITCGSRKWLEYLKSRLESCDIRCSIKGPLRHYSNNKIVKLNREYSNAYRLSIGAKGLVKLWSQAETGLHLLTRKWDKITRRSSF